MSLIKTVRGYEDYEEINLKLIFQSIWLNKKIVIFITLLFAIFSVIYSIQLPNQYTSNALIAPNSSSESMNSTLRSYSSLASFAGIDMNSSTQDKSVEAIARLKSFNFFSQHFLPKIKLENLLAIEGWDQNTNTITYIDSSFSDGAWVDGKPSSQDAFKVYNSIFKIEKDNSTGFVTMSITNKSPEIAKKWLDILIFSINESMRDNDRAEAERALIYLNQLLVENKRVEITNVVANLISEQTKSLMMVAANPEYIFKSIDPPIVPDKKSSPYRAMICIVGTVIGFFLSMFIILYPLIRSSYIR